MAKEAKKLTGSDYLCMAGGVALNCVANGKLLKENLFKDIYIQPAAGDAGGALGAAQAIHYLYFDQKRVIDRKYDSMNGAYLGPYYSDKEAITTFKKYKAVYDKIEPFDDLCKKVAELLNDGKVIGWFQGRMEFGPRALGNRSILGDARNNEMQKKLNLKIKQRESFRPFAPSVLAEESAEYFDLASASPYMLLIADVIEKGETIYPLTIMNLIYGRNFITREAIFRQSHTLISQRGYRPYIKRPIKGTGN